MAETGRTVIFDEVLQAGSDAAAALGALMLHYQRLGETPLTDREQLALDALRAVIIERTGLLPMLSADTKSDAVLRETTNTQNPADLDEGTVSNTAATARSNGMIRTTPFIPMLPLTTGFETGATAQLPRHALNGNGAPDAAEAVTEPGEPVEGVTPPEAVGSPGPDEKANTGDAGTGAGPTAEGDDAAAPGAPTNPSPAEARAAKKLNGRTIERIDDDLLAKLSQSRRPQYAHEKATEIIIIDDKTIEVNNKPDKLRTPVKGDPSVVMLVLNTVLKGEVEGKRDFTKSELHELIGDPSINLSAIWQSVDRFLKSGLFERRPKTGGETVFGLPKLLEIGDMREPAPIAAEEPKGFLART